MDISTRDSGLSVGEAAARVGLTTYTLRWYEQEGLVAPVGRDSAGRRRYTEADLDRLLLLTRLRRTGMPVRDMRRYAELARLGDRTRDARRALFEAHRARVLARMTELEEDLKCSTTRSRCTAARRRNDDPSTDRGRRSGGLRHRAGLHGHELRLRRAATTPSRRAPCTGRWTWA